MTKPLTKSAFGFQAQAKFSLERAQQAVHWIEAVLDKKLDIPNGEVKDQVDFGAALKDGIVLCE